MAQIKNCENPMAPMGISYVAVRADKRKTESNMDFIKEFINGILCGAGLMFLLILVLLMYLHCRYGVILYVY